MASQGEYPAGNTPPPYITIGPQKFRDAINNWLAYLLSMSYLPMDASMVVVPGTSVSPGRMKATGTSGGGSNAIPPLYVVDASAKDKDGNAHPGRVRVYNGRLGGLLPAEMSLLDIVLPNGTDNHCYLTLLNGTNYVFGKVLVDGDTGLFPEAHVYVVQDIEDADADWCYLLISTWTFDGTKATKVSQDASGNQSLKPSWSADGTILQAFWGPLNLSLYG